VAAQTLWVAVNHANLVAAQSLWVAAQTLRVAAPLVAALLEDVPEEDGEASKAVDDAMDQHLVGPTAVVDMGVPHEASKGQVDAANNQEGLVADHVDLVGHATEVDGAKAVARYYEGLVAEPTVIWIWTWSEVAFGYAACFLLHGAETGSAASEQVEAHQPSFEVHHGSQPAFFPAPPSDS